MCVCVCLSSIPVNVQKSKTGVCVCCCLCGFLMLPACVSTTHMHIYLHTHFYTQVSQDVFTNRSADVEDLSKAMHGMRTTKADKEAAKWEAERVLLQDEIEQSKGRERQAVVRFQNTMQEVRLCEWIRCAHNITALGCDAYMRVAVVRLENIVREGRRLVYPGRDTGFAPECFGD
jgi:hypothetical protein